MGRRYDGDECKRCNEKIHQEIYYDIKSFINKAQVLENKLDYVSGMLSPLSKKKKDKSNNKFSPKEEAKVVIEKIRLLERKINNFSKELNPEYTVSTNDSDQISSNEAFKKLIEKLKMLEEKLGDFSKIKIAEDPTKKEGSSNDTAQIKEKLEAMEEKIEQFYKLIPNNVRTSSVDKAHEDPPDIMKQVQDLAEEMNLNSKITSSTSTTDNPSTKKRKTLLPVAIFSGEITPKRKSSVKKGFITWPSEDGSEIRNDRQCYTMRFGQSRTNIKPNNLISEPSEFYSDLNLKTQTSRLSFKESRAWWKSKVKNSELKR